MNKTAFFYVITLILLSINANGESHAQSKAVVNIASAHSDLTLLSSLHKLGEGDMKIMFWNIYKAEFYSKTGNYDPHIYPQALKLTYKRDIDKSDFIEATSDQWNKLRKQNKATPITTEQENDWLQKLSTVFPNINNKDTILLVVDKNQNSHFYLQRSMSDPSSAGLSYKELGTITDTEFGPYFLSIWLSKHTSEPKLRNKLIGAKS